MSRGPQRVRRVLDNMLIELVRAIYAGIENSACGVVERICPTGLRILTDAVLRAAFPDLCHIFWFVDRAGRAELSSHCAL